MRANEFNSKIPGTIYVDMDGVLVDLYGHSAKLAKIQHYNQMPDWERFYNTVNVFKLFADAPKFMGADHLMKIAHHFSKNVVLLTSPLQNNVKDSIRGKKVWLSEHMPDYLTKTIYEHDKQKYAVSNGVPNILIDDSGRNISAWSAAGGIAIKYKADEDSLTDVINTLTAIRDKQNEKTISSNDTNPTNGL
jgi:hypothetical protein